jgi:iron(III) transport system substrate-binding protein
MAHSSIPLSSRRHKLSAGVSRRNALLASASAGLVLATGCGRKATKQVTVYAALDREFSEPILKRFEQETGIRVLAKYDVESTKTVGLVNAIIEEQARPRCDVFWNNEILHALRLKKLGLLAESKPSQANDFPAEFRDPGGLWFGMAARARVFIVDRKSLGDEPAPTSINDLADPKSKGKCCLAKPLHGTTATNAAVLFALRGTEEATKFWKEVHENAAVVSGNKQVAQDVAAGRYVFGITDTDDAVIERDRGADVEIVFPSMVAADDEANKGALFIPNTLCKIKGGPNPEEAEQLIDFLLTAAVEDELAKSESAQIPLSTKAKEKSRVLTGETPPPISVDFEKVAEVWGEAASQLQNIFSAA